MPIYQSYEIGKPVRTRPFSTLRAIAEYKEEFQTYSGNPTRLTLVRAIAASIYARLV